MPLSCWTLTFCWQTRFPQMLYVKHKVEEASSLNHASLPAVHSWIMELGANMQMWLYAQLWLYTLSYNDSSIMYYGGLGRERHNLFWSGHFHIMKERGLKRVTPKWKSSLCISEDLGEFLSCSVARPLTVTMTSSGSESCRVTEGISMKLLLIPRFPPEGLIWNASLISNQPTGEADSGSNRRLEKKISLCMTLPSQCWISDCVWVTSSQCCKHPTGRESCGRAELRLEVLHAAARLRAPGLSPPALTGAEQSLASIKVNNQAHGSWQLLLDGCTGMMITGGLYKSCRYGNKKKPLPFISLH